MGSRRLRPMTAADLPSMPGSCARCTFWESTLADLAAPADHVDRREMKVEWAEIVTRHWGYCGVIAFADDEPIGHLTLAPAMYVPRLGAFATTPVGADAAVVMSAHVAPELRGKGLGKQLVQSAAGLVARRDIRALEAVGTYHDGPYDESMAKSDGKKRVRWSLWLAAGVLFGLALGFVFGLARPRVRNSADGIPPPAPDDSSRPALAAGTLRAVCLLGGKSQRPCGADRSCRSGSGQGGVGRGRDPVLGLLRGDGVCRRPADRSPDVSPGHVCAAARCVRNYPGRAGRCGGDVSPRGGRTARQGPRQATGAFGSGTRGASRHSGAGGGWYLQRRPVVHVAGRVAAGGRLRGGTAPPDHSTVADGPAERSALAAGLGAAWHRSPDLVRQPESPEPATYTHREAL